MEVTSWSELSPAAQKEELEKQAIVQKTVEVLQEWARVYGRLARALADQYGEEAVLDTLEQTWWSLQYEAGLSWRDEFDQDVKAAFKEMEARWRRRDVNCVSAYFGAIFHPLVTDDRWELVTYGCYHDVFREMDERKIGISWCMSDMAAVRGWSSNVVMDFPQVLVRGCSYCHQIRCIDMDADPQLDHWSKELSEKFGWRSIQKLEEE
jgi:hypothetical protein